MKIIIATCFESNEERARMLRKACLKKGYDVEIVSTDFSHVRKSKRNNIPEEITAIKTDPYDKNLSLKRILSHRSFASQAFEYIEKKNPDLIWLMAPANSLIQEADRYKKRHDSVRLIIDMIDMWPESLPVSFDKSVFPFSLWKNIRRRHINCADRLVSECDLYREILGKEYDGEITTIHWAREEKIRKMPADLPDEGVSLCYIGSINNIIDIQGIVDFISSLDKKAVIHVVGDGEKREEFLRKLKEVCDVFYYGEERDENRKAEIFSRCHAGINLYKKGLYIGLTVKCIDYFQHGLPIINNIKGDTWQLVEQYRAGINIDKDCGADNQTIVDLRRNNQIEELFKSHFSEEIFEKKCLDTISEVCQ